MNISDDGYGRMTHYTRFAGAVNTALRDDGYYWSYPIYTSAGGETKLNGPFPTRRAALDDELASIKRKKRKARP